LKGSKRETIEKIPKPLRHKTYSSKRQPEFGKTRVFAFLSKKSYVVFCSTYVEICSNIRTVFMIRIATKLSFSLVTAGFIIFGIYGVYHLRTERVDLRRVVEHETRLLGYSLLDGRVARGNRTPT